jgi:hypothetical protein
MILALIMLVTCTLADAVTSALPFLTDRNVCVHLAWNWTILSTAAILLVAEVTNGSNVMKLAFCPSEPTDSMTSLTVFLAMTKRAARIRRRRSDGLLISLNVTATDVTAVLTSVMESMTTTINLTNLPPALHLNALETNSFLPTIDLASRWALTVVDNAAVLMGLTKEIVPFSHAVLLQAEQTFAF